MLISGLTAKCDDCLLSLFIIYGSENISQEEEARLQRLKQEEAANAEFEKWKDAFTVDNEGTMEDETKESGGLLHDFVEYIKVVLWLWSAWF